MVKEFLELNGLHQIQQLLLQQRDDLSYLLFGQLWNCIIYSRHPILIPTELVSNHH